MLVVIVHPCLQVICISLGIISLCSFFLQRNIEVCPQCGHLKQIHILCGHCYEKIRQETFAIKDQIRAMEGGPHRAPTVETTVLYEGEKPRDQDEGKRIIERNRKRPSWFTLD